MGFGEGLAQPRDEYERVMKQDRQRGFVKYRLERFETAAGL
jgi:hypothetical protein